MVSCEDGTSEIAQAIGEANEITDAKDETNDVSKAKSAQAEQIRRKLTTFKEENGVVALRRLFVKKIIDIQEKATGGDVSLFGIEENGFESARRANSLDAKLHVLQRECGNLSVEWHINRMSVGVADTLAAKLGLFSNEYAMLFGECAKSAAELCIKKMRLGALLWCKLDKRTILEGEIAGARSMKKELSKKLRDAVMDDKQTEISKRKLKKMKRALCDDEVRNINEVKGSTFVKQSLSVLMEMMKGVKCGEKLAPGVDEAIALADAWTVASIDMCVMKVCVGVLVDKHSIYEVLKSEIVETWKVEKEVKDGLAMYQKTYATDIVVKKNSEVDTVVWKCMGLCAVGGAVVGIIAANALAKRKA